MTKKIPNYLRIHSDQEHDAAAQSATMAQDLVQDFWSAYSDATGWRPDERSRRMGERMDLLPAIDTGSVEDSDAYAVPVTKSAASRLAESATQLVEQLETNRGAIRRQEIELAARAANFAGTPDPSGLADRIETTLADAAAACRCDAAVMYMLDDATEFLKARAVFGISPSRLQDPPRELRGSRADLEAMVQGVVAIDDLNAGGIDSWNCPESFAAGICVVIQSGDVPIGTLWLFRQTTTQFGVAESAAARMAASNLSLQMSQGCIDTRPPSAGSDEPIQDLSQWQFESLPIGASLDDDWSVDGMIESPMPWATGWHHWDVLPDGTLMMAIAEAVDSSAKGAMSAAIARAALTAHTGYRHTPAELMQRVSDTLWQTSTGEQLVSMLYVRVDPETGEGEVVAAGSITAMIGNRYGIRPLVDGRCDPLNSNIDARFKAESFRLTRGETLLAYTQGLAADGISQNLLGDQLRGAMADGDANPLARIRREIVNVPMGTERGAATLMRR